MWSSNNRGEFSNRKFQQIFLEGTANFHVIIYMAIFSNLILMHTFTLLNNKNRTRLSNLKFDNVKKFELYLRSFRFKSWFLQLIGLLFMTEGIFMPTSKLWNARKKLVNFFPLMLRDNTENRGRWKINPVSKDNFFVVSILVILQQQNYTCIRKYV